MEETWVRSLVREDATWRRAAGVVCYHCWACAPEPRGHKSWAHVLQLQKPMHAWAWAPQKEKPPQWDAGLWQLESSPHSPQLEESPSSSEHPAQPKVNNFFKNQENYLLWDTRVADGSPSRLNWSSPLHRMFKKYSSITWLWFDTPMSTQWSANTHVSSLQASL